MEMQQIRYFLAVCDQGSITQAAQLAYVSQPSLTQAIKKLEDEMGGALFTRTRSGCELTPLGRMVEAKLRKIYKELQAAKAEAIRFNRLNTVPLRIGLMSTIGARRLSPCLVWYQQEYPNIELELVVDSEAELLRQLDSGALDLAISAPALLPALYRTTLLYEERYVVAFNPAHRFSQMQQVDLQAIQAEPYLDRLNCELREDLKGICQTQDIGLYATYRSNSEEWILQMVKAGIGVALMPEYSVPKQAADIDCRYLREPEISRKVYAIYTQQPAARFEVQALLDNLSRKP